jgi:tight adherence protein C
MDPLIFLVFGVFVTIAGVVVFASVVASRLIPGIRRERLVPQLVSGTGNESILRWAGAETWWQRLAEAVGRKTAPREAKNISKIRQRLGWAGIHSPSAVAIYTGSRFVLALVLGLVYPLTGLILGQAMPNALFVAIGLAYLGMWLPTFLLGRLIARRRDEMTSALPDFLDLLTICVEAGMSFDAALSRIIHQPEAGGSPLYQELSRMHLEIGAGRPRAEALRAFADRCGVQDVTTMVSVFVQTERLGTSIGSALRVHSDTARTQRRYRLEAQAYLAPLKMIFPTMIFLTPAFFLVALAPSLLGFLAVMRSFGK